MISINCKTCGGLNNVDPNQTIYECEYCGRSQPLPKFNDDNKINLLNRATKQRLRNQFDVATGIFETIVAQWPDEAEAYWGLCLCKYGIEYISDARGNKIPTCHRTLTTSIMNDDDYRSALKHASDEAILKYHEEAVIIDSLQKRIIEIASKVDPYDVFICYKENDDNTHQRTDDSALAQDLYDDLLEKGYKVFFARRTLSKVAAGSDFEAYIYSALTSAKVMLAIGTKPEYYESAWVKNEWSRYIKMISGDSKKMLIPCYKNMDPYDLPAEFSNLQGLDMTSPTFYGNLMENIKRVISGTTQAKSPASATTDSLLQRAALFLEDKNWTQASKYCNNVLDIEPNNATAFTYLMLIDYKLSKLPDVLNLNQSIEFNSNYTKAVRFADDKLKQELIAYCDAVNKKIGEKNRSIQILDNKKSQLLVEIDKATKQKNDIENKQQHLTEKISQHCAEVDKIKSNIDDNTAKLNEITSHKNNLGLHLLWGLVIALCCYLMISMPMNILDANPNSSLSSVFENMPTFNIALNWVLGIFLVLSGAYFHSSLECESLWKTICATLGVTAALCVIIFVITRFDVFINILFCGSSMPRGIFSMFFCISSLLVSFFTIWQYLSLMCKKIRNRTTVSYLRKIIHLNEKKYQSIINSDTELTSLQKQANENLLYYKRTIGELRSIIGEQYDDYLLYAKANRLTPNLTLPDWLRK